MSKLNEQSAYHRAAMLWCILAIIALTLWLGFELYQLSQGYFSFLGFGYIGFFALILLWRYGFHYSYTLTDRAFVAQRTGFGFHSEKIILFSDIEYFAGKYVRKPFAHVRTKGYWYSSGDDRPVRTLVYFEKGKRKAILFKVSENFIERLRKIKPDAFLHI